MKLLKNGIPIAQRMDTIEEKIAVNIFKNTKHAFEVVHDRSGLHKVINIRSVLHTALHSGVTKESLTSYIDHFDSPDIVWIDNSDHAMLDFFHAEGITNIQRITVQDLNAEPVCDAGKIILLDDQFANEISFQRNHIYVLYSLDKLQAGPILIPEVSACVDCYLKIRTEPDAASAHYWPAYYRTFIYNLLVNTIYYLKNDLFKGLYNDVGLPIKKYFTLAHPHLHMEVTNVYKDMTCGTCMK
ncbi:hypothetical protein LQV63_15030 [Paenibacillus profundus]|uniref:Uncharacterized protein n=1 Tax=Paenibacillus profundus TaxID=1173085 RepID=A0ABS8YF47_9BACL|nr:MULTISPECIES: hypothetical protein [Paenibacillus]MCE5170628.1 hypothetical protein [Paenibacillus profundus]